MAVGDVSTRFIVPDSFFQLIGDTVDEIIIEDVTEITGEIELVELTGEVVD